MQVKVLAILLAAVASSIPVVRAQGVSKSGQMSSSPLGTSTPAPDLATYGTALATTLQQLRDAANRADAKNAPNGANDEQMAHDAVLRQLLQTLGVVRTAPMSYRTEKLYIDAEQRVKSATQRVEGVHEPASISAPANDAVQAIGVLIDDIKHHK